MPASLRAALPRAKPAALFVLDAAVAALALLAAMLARYEFQIPTATYGRMAWLLAPAVVLLPPVVNAALGSYRQIWRYTSLRESRVVLVSAAALGALLLGLRLAGVRFGGPPASPIVVPYSIALLVPTFYAVGAVAGRSLRRWQGLRRRSRAAEPAVPTLVLGAGSTASALILDAQRVGVANHLVGLLDDDPGKRGRRLHGLPILGATTDLVRTMQDRGVARVVVAMPSADTAVVRMLIQQAEGAGAVVRVLPGVRSTLDGAGEPGSPTLDDLVDAVEIKTTLLNRLSPDRARRVLVTGGAGYIGNILVRRLLEDGYRVRVLDNFTFGGEPLADLEAHPALDLHRGDIANLRDVAAAVRDCGTVVALAAIVGDPACGVDAEETLTLNFEATKVLTEACRFYGVERLVFASSCSVYGASEGDAVLDETSALHPVSLYARTRILSEDVVFARCGSTAPVVLRLATVFGHSRRMRFDLVVNALTVRGVVDGAFQVFGGEQWRPFVHCADAAEAFLLAATAPRDRVAGQVFNVGADALNFTIGEVGRVVEEEVRAAGVAVQAHVTDAADDARNYRVAFGKIQQVLGFEPRYTLREGVREMIEAVQASPALRSYSRALFSNEAVMRGRKEASAGDGSAVGAPPG